MNRGLKRAIEAAGGQGRLARLLGIRQQAVSQWKEVPARHIIAIENLTGVPREELRPDLYPPRRPLARSAR
jgi:DNA-binding transcriptional regulator YdaS (Cro superfamily)